MELSTRFLNFVTSADQFSDEVPRIQSELDHIFTQQKIHYYADGDGMFKFWFLGMAISVTKVYL